jgi:hypothetical protein
LSITQRASRVGYVAMATGLLTCVTCVTCVTACSSSVQELGNNGQDEPTLVGTTHDEAAHSGFGASWACPDDPGQRELACPLTRPLDGDSCASRNAAPCSYVSGLGKPLDTANATVDPDVATFCICTRDLRWACISGLTMRTLDMPIHDGDPCEDTLTIESPGVTCKCELGVARCSR